jgi:hypothetical protein
LIHNTWKRFSEAVEKACTDAVLDKTAELAVDVGEAWRQGANAK